MNVRINPMSDADSTFKDRNINRENAAEIIAIDFFKSRNIGYIRYGFDEKFQRVDSRQWWKIPEVIRSAPDFIAFGRTVAFVEAKGYKKELKIKINDLVSYEHWNRILPLFLFVRNFDNSNQYYLKWDNVKSIIYGCDTEKYNNGKTYFILPENELVILNNEKKKANS